jgi:hypothetical protein
MRAVNDFSYGPSTLLASNHHMVTKSTRKIHIIKEVKLRSETQKGKGGKENIKTQNKSKET